MNKENEENSIRGLLLGIAAVDPDQGNSQGFSPITVPENEPARSLQLSPSFFVADTCEEDDESMMIPPTQEFLIPSTPPPADIGEKESSSSHGHNDTTISNLDETYMDDDVKTLALEVQDDSDLNDMTQDLPELDETQEILGSKPMSTDRSKDLEKETQGDDDWNLRFSETQETQELLGSARVRQSKEKEDTTQVPVADDKAKTCSTQENSTIEIPSEKPHQDIEQNALKPPETSICEENDSDDEIEPSQSCLSDFPRDTYSAYRDQLSQLALDPPTAHSTPDSTFNGGSKDKAEPDITVVPSPINKPFTGETKSNLESDESSLIVKADSKDATSNLESETTVVAFPVVESCNGGSKDVKTNLSIDTPFDGDVKSNPDLDVPSSAVATKKNIPSIEEKESSMKAEQLPKPETVDLVSESTEVQPPVLDTNQPPVIVLDTQPNEQVQPPVLDLDTEPREQDQPPVLVLDTQPEEPVDESMEDKDEKQVVVDTIELMSSVDDSVKDVREEVKAEEDSKVKVGEESAPVEDVKNSKESMNLKEHEIHTSESSSVSKPSISSFGVSLDLLQGLAASEKLIINCKDNSAYIKKDTPGIETLPETLSTVFLPPHPPTRSRLSRKQAFDRSMKFGQPLQYEKLKKTSVGTFQDVKSLEKIFQPFGITLDQEGSDAILALRPNENLQLTKKLEFTIKDNRVFLEESIELGHPSDPHRPSAVSPHSSSCSSTTTVTSTLTSSLHSGEMADISNSSSSAKSANFSSVQLLDSSGAMSSQEHKTSTQNEKNSFVNVLKDEKMALSPIQAEEKIESPVPSRKRGRKAAAKPNNKAADPAPKRKRGRAAAKGKEVETPEAKETSPVLEVSTDLDVRPKKTRRKKVEETPVEAIAGPSVDIQTITPAENSGDAYADSPYGSILPGIRVMARWKDGYYYPGEVISQEMEGRWSICFDDNDIRVIPQENLIKVAILAQGTSVFAKSPDDYYDPGLVVGSFREGNCVGYEVELDNGVTKRYPRTSVILSTDQAKLLTSTRPPTTPSTNTINFDNILFGKRKRTSKTRHSPDPNPSVKKSPRVVRPKKNDPNVDSTADSSSGVTDQGTSFKANAETTETEDELPSKQRNTRKRKAAKAGASKIKQALKPIVVKNPKLFKDYAFLLTNADRKKDSCPSEDEGIVPFDKDGLVDYIFTRGGMIIEVFEDIQKCKRKNIYLLANTYLRTMKYIKCIAAGIPCVKHTWVQNCCYKGELLNLVSYKLPSGISLITDQIVEWHGKSDVLKGVKISLVSSADCDFVDIWTPVLLAAKADFVQKWNLPSSKSGACVVVDVLITNPYCPNDVLSSARRRKIPIVSSEWIIQSLIAGKRLPYDAHPKFKHDFTE